MQVVIKKSLKAKRTQIKISKGQVILTMPKNGSLARAQEFLNSASNWIKKRLGADKRVSFAEGEIISLLGREYIVRYTEDASRAISLSASELLIPKQSVGASYRMKNFLSTLLKAKVTQVVREACNKLKVNFNKITIRDTSSRWGSCSSKGNLSFALKLVFVKEEMLEYVVAHEVCHLKEMNHSKKFWDLVSSIYPNWRQARAQLKEEKKYIV